MGIVFSVCVGREGGCLKFTKLFPLCRPLNPFNYSRQCLLIFLKVDVRGISRDIQRILTRFICANSVITLGWCMLHIHGHSLFGVCGEGGGLWSSPIWKPKLISDDLPELTWNLQNCFPYAGPLIHLITVVNVFWSFWKLTFGESAVTSEINYLWK
jgi:hypothetical protein